MNHRHDLRYAFLTALAILCTFISVRAQDSIAGPQPQRIVSSHQLASLVLSQPAPDYPPVAKVNYLEGVVQIEITVDNHGRVSAAHVLRGNPILAAASLKAVTHWLYHPLTTATGPEGFATTVRVRFSLRHPGVSLTPHQAEQDFQRQVKPPQSENPAMEKLPEGVVHMHLLVNDQGQVVDRDADPKDKAQFEAACENLRGWTFQPARWGSMPIASYLNVDVPVGAPAVTRAASTAAR